VTAAWKASSHANAKGTDTDGLVIRYFRLAEEEKKKKK
jgi:hypothetical protein